MLQVCQKLKARNEDLARTAAEAPVAARSQEQEARELVAQAQRDVECSRTQAAKADAEKRSMLQQVRAVTRMAGMHGRSALSATPHQRRLLRHRVM